MAHQIKERPNLYCLSKNEIRYVFTVDGLDRPGLFFEAKLLYRILTGKAKINWQMNEVVNDCNIEIRVNGVLVQSVTESGGGSMLVKGGDVVNVSTPITTPWTSPDPYIILQVFKDGASLYGEYTPDQDPILSYEFVAEADSIYTIAARTNDEGTIPHTYPLLVLTESRMTELKSFLLKPNADGSVYLPIQQYIDSVLDYVMPTENITNASAQACMFYIATREITNASPDPEYTGIEGTKPPRIAIKAGLESHRYSRNNLFTYLDAEKQWMTWQPSNRMVWKDQLLHLTAFFKEGHANGYTLRVKYKTTAGVETTVDTPLAVPGFFIHFKADPVTLGIPTGQLYFYEVSILNGADVLLNPYRLYVNYDPCYAPKDMVSMNSLGGVDSVRITGEITNNIERTVQDSEGGFQANEWSAIVKSHQAAQTGIGYRRTFKGDVGYQRTIRQQESLIDILLSEKVYQYIDARYVPVVITQTNLLLRKSTDKLASFPVEWKFSEENGVYTPTDIALGLGTDTEDY